jgi:hypothetical protein
VPPSAADSPQGTSENSACRTGGNQQTVDIVVSMEPGSWLRGLTLAQSDKITAAKKDTSNYNFFKMVRTYLRHTRWGSISGAKNAENDL